MSENGVTAYEFKNGNLLAAQEGDEINCVEGSLICTVARAAGIGAGRVAQLTVRGAGFAARGVGSGVRAVGGFIANRPVVSFFRERQPVRSFFREVQPIRRVGGAIGNVLENRPVRSFFSEVQPVRAGLRGAGAVLGGTGRFLFGRR